MDSSTSYLDRLRVLVVSEDSLTLAGLEAYFQADERWLVWCHEAGAEGVVDLSAQVRPDIVVWDLGWDSPGPALLAPILASLPAALLLVAGAEEMAEARAAGAHAVLTRSATAERVMAAAQAAAEGLWVGEQAPPAATAEDHRGKAPPEMLTPREMDVLRCLAQGHTNKAISQELGVSEHTVKFHVRTILRKLDAQSRTEAVMRSARLGLIPL